MTTKVQSEQIADASISTDRIADDAVTSAKLDTNISIAGTLASTGVLTANAGVVVDNITIDGTEIDLSSGDLTIDVAGVIKLDADGAEIQIKDGGTEIGAINMASSNLNIDAKVADKDIVFRGIDGSSDITALTLDMSAAGAATFNSTVNGLTLSSAGVTGPDSSNFTLNTANSFRLNIDSNDSGTGESFIVGHNQTLINQSNVLLKVQEDGNVGIGTSSPATTLHLDASGGAVMRLQRTSANASNKLELSHDGTDGTITSTNDLILTTTNGTATFNSTIIVGTNVVQTSTNAVHFMGGSTQSFGNTAGIGIAGGDGFHVNGSGAGDLVIAAAAGENIVLGTSASGGPYSRLRINTSGRQTFNDSGTANAHANFVGEVGISSRALAFEHTVGGGEVGTIVTSASGTNYGSGSDYRLKENVNYSWDATTRLKQLKPARFNFIADETNTLVDGFLAHEVSSIVPEAITGEKDAVDAENNPDYQQIDHSKLVPLLVKTIQELEARITTLEG